ncbi:uncharacterized protein LOC144114090 [Amblyomma americanum]
MRNMVSTYAAVCVLATVLALAAADGKAGAVSKGVQPAGKPAAAKPAVVVVKRPEAPKQPEYDYWRPWYTYNSPQQHHRGHARKESHHPPPKQPQPHSQPPRQQHPQRQAPPQNLFNWPSNSGGFQWGRGDDKVKDSYVKEVKPVAYDTVIEEEKKVVVKEEPKVVVKEVPKVVVTEPPKVIVQEVPKKEKVMVKECKDHHHDHDSMSKFFKKMEKDFKKFNKQFKDHHKHHQKSHGKAIVFFRTQTPYYYYTRAPRYQADNYYYNGY